MPGISWSVYYKIVQGFRVTCLLSGQNNTKGYDTITDEWMNEWMNNKKTFSFATEKSACSTEK